MASCVDESAPEQRSVPDVAPAERAQRLLEEDFQVREALAVALEPRPHRGQQPADDGAAGHGGDCAHAREHAQLVQPAERSAVEQRRWNPPPERQSAMPFRSLPGRYRASRLDVSTARSSGRALSSPPLTDAGPSRPVRGTAAGSR